jgi:hypothetical protein
MNPTSESISACPRQPRQKITQTAITAAMRNSSAQEIRLAGFTRPSRLENLKNRYTGAAMIRTRFKDGSAAARG